MFILDVLVRNSDPVTHNLSPSRRQPCIGITDEYASTHKYLPPASGFGLIGRQIGASAGGGPAILSAIERSWLTVVAVSLSKHLSVAETFFTYCNNSGHTSEMISEMARQFLDKCMRNSWLPRHAD
ncbi:hypothetical protein PENSPDRAFT_371372 [Peniophora sp. CONT]|nr:hypothetical protein PENSPDRAFT_371372 [Peniophora sp. CONT]